MIFESVLGLGSLAVSAYGAVNSFSEAQKQKSLASEAATAAAKAMEEARKKLDVNVYEQLAVPMQAYEREREALISAGAQAIESGKESERGAAATAGRVQMAQAEAQAGQREAMAKELADLAKLTATEEGRLRDLKVDLDVSEAGAMRLKERDAERAAAMYEQQGWEGVTSAVGQAAKLVPLYLKNRKEIKRQKLLDEVAFNPRKDIKFDTGNDFESNQFQTY